MHSPPLFFTLSQSEPRLITETPRPSLNMGTKRNVLATNLPEVGRGFPFGGMSNKQPGKDYEVCGVSSEKRIEKLKEGDLEANQTERSRG